MLFLRTILLAVIVLVHGNNFFMTKKYNPKHAELFKDVMFLVEADSYASHNLWVYYFYEPRKGVIPAKIWEQVSLGHMITIGTMYKRPICISIFYSIIDGKRVMFYEGCSQLVDHLMIENWLKHFTLNSIRWDNGTRWGHCDADNFHHCLNAIRNG